MDTSFFIHEVGNKMKAHPESVVGQQFKHQVERFIEKPEVKRYDRLTTSISFVPRQTLEDMFFEVASKYAEKTFVKNY